MATDFSRQIFRKKTTPLVNIEEVEISGDSENYTVVVNSSLNELTSFQNPFGSFTNTDIIKNYLSIVPVVIYKTGDAPSANEFTNNEVERYAERSVLRTFEAYGAASGRILLESSAYQIKSKTLSPIIPNVDDGSQDALFYDPTINTFNNKLYMPSIEFSNLDLDNPKAISVLLFCDFDVDGYILNQTSTLINSDDLPEATERAVADLGESFEGINELINNFQSSTFLKVLEENLPTSVLVQDYRMSSLIPTEGTLFSPFQQSVLEDFDEKTSTGDSAKLLDRKQNSLFGSLGFTLDNPRETLTGCFIFNKKGFVQHQSKVAEIIPLLSNEAFNQISNRIEIENIKIYKRTKETLCNSGFTRALVLDNNNSLSRIEEVSFLTDQDLICYSFEDRHFNSTPQEEIKYECEITLNDNSQQYFLEFISAIDLYNQAIEIIINRSFDFSRRASSTEEFKRTIQEVFEELYDQDAAAETFYAGLYSFIINNIYSAFNLTVNPGIQTLINNMTNPDNGANARTYQFINTFLDLVKQNIIKLLNFSGIQLTGQTTTPIGTINKVPVSFVEQDPIVSGTILDVDNTSANNFSISVLNDGNYEGRTKEFTSSILTQLPSSNLYSRVLNETRKYFDIRNLDEIADITTLDYENNLIQYFSPSALYYSTQEEKIINLLSNNDLTTWNPISYIINEIIVLLDNLEFLNYDKAKSIITLYSLTVPNTQDTFMLGVLKIFTEYLANRFNIETISPSSLVADNPPDSVEVGSEGTRVRLADSEFYLGDSIAISTDFLTMVNLSLTPEIDGEIAWNPELFAELTTNQHLLEIAYILSKCRTVSEYSKNIESRLNPEIADRKSLQSFKFIPVEKAVNLPIQLKSLVTAPIINYEKLTFDWFRRRDDGSVEPVTIVGDEVITYDISDILKNFINYSIFKFNFELLYEIEFLSNFNIDSSGDILVKDPQWKKLNFINLNLLPSGTTQVLCRIKKASRIDAPIDDYRNHNFNIVNSLFILETENIATAFNINLSTFIAVPEEEYELA